MKYAVDWEEQWALFAENFFQGKARIDLSRYGKALQLRLLPGPGFGDLSHETTRLMLNLMQGRMTHQKILDIGCGSGILSLAALLLGAESATGIDIDEEALLHSQQNARENNLSHRAQFTKSLPQTSSNQVLLINMILPEQKQALQPIHTRLSKLRIASGILESQKNEYLALTHSWGWNPIEEQKLGEWMGWVFN